MRILLAEDDEALREAFEELLCREGYEVIKASNVRSSWSVNDPALYWAIKKT